ncbi:hypothetical protein ACFSVJ_29045 [Prauserella oleivorans]
MPGRPGQQPPLRRDHLLSAVTYGGEVTVESDEPRPFFALVVPLSGTALLRLGDDEVTVSEYSGAVVSLPTGSG